MVILARSVVDASTWWAVRFRSNTPPSSKWRFWVDLQPPDILLQGEEVDLGKLVGVLGGDGGERGPVVVFHAELLPLFGVGNCR